MTKTQKRTASEITAELAEKMENGLSLLKEITHVWIMEDEDDKKLCGCSLGMAYAGTVGDAAKAYQSYWRSGLLGSEFLRKKLKISESLLCAVSRMHLDGVKAATIVKKLRKGEFKYLWKASSKPTQPHFLLLNSGLPHGRLFLCPVRNRNKWLAGVFSKSSVYKVVLHNS